MRCGFHDLRGVQSVQETSSVYNVQSASLPKRVQPRREISMSTRTVKNIALVTVVMSIPLLLSYNIKYQYFPQGLPYLFLFFWGLFSVYATPALLLLSVITTIRIGMSSNQSTRSSSLAWNLSAILVGVVAEVIFIAARNSPP
jgi:hypothetical protein